MNKTAAASAAQLAKCILLHAYSCTTAVPSCMSILRLKILKKLRTASLNSEFTGSYKNKCTPIMQLDCKVSCSHNLK